MPRKFKPGAWVRLQGKTLGPKMQVLKYIPKKHPIFDFVNTDTYVECVWIQDGERKSEIFHQDRLMKTIESRGLFKV